MLGDQRFSSEVARRRSGTPTWIAQERMTFASLSQSIHGQSPTHAERLHVSGGWCRKHKHLTSAFRSGALSRRFSSFSFQHSCAWAHGCETVPRDPSALHTTHRCTVSSCSFKLAHRRTLCSTKWRIAIQSDPDEVANCNPIRRSGELQSNQTLRQSPRASQQSSRVRRIRHLSSSGDEARCCPPSPSSSIVM